MVVFVAVIKPDFSHTYHVAVGVCLARGSPYQSPCRMFFVYLFSCPFVLGSVPFISIAPFFIYIHHLDHNNPISQLA